MDLETFRRRRQAVAHAQRHLNHFERAIPGDVELRGDGRQPEQGEYTVGPEADGGWVAQQWYSEVGGTHPIASVHAGTEALALDWVWWIAAKDFLNAYVRPAGDQKDLQRRATAREILAMSVRGFRERYDEEARLPQEDAAEDPEELARLAGAAGDLMAMRIARNPRTAVVTLADLAGHSEPFVRWQVAGNPAADAATLERLRETEDPVVRWYLAARAGTPTAEVIAWSRADPALWTAVLDRDDIPAVELAALDSASSGSQRVRIAAHPGADAALLSRLAEECDVPLAIALLADGRLGPGGVATVLERVESAWLGQVRSQIQRRLHDRERTIVLRVGRDAADRAARSTSGTQRAIAAVASGTDPGLVGLLGQDEAQDVRVLVASRPDLALTLQQRLLNDPSEAVRRALAVNQTIAAETAVGLAADGARMVRHDAISNRSMPVDLLPGLVGGPDDEIARIMLRVRVGS